MGVIFKLIQPEVRVGSDGVITATLSTEARDRDGDIIRAAGWQLDDFLRHPILLSSHDYSSLRSQIGEWRNVRVEGDRLVGEPFYYTGQGNAEADWGHKLATMGKAAYSVGFVPLESIPLKGAAYGAQDYQKQELLECSHVSVPSNREALQLMAKSATGPAADYARDLLTLPAQKWPLDPNSWDQQGHCIVSGCDDASMLSIPICEEHLKYLVNAPAEPEGDTDEDALGSMASLRAAVRSVRRSFRVKAGRTISAATMSQLHSEFRALEQVHDAACTDDACDDGDAADEGRAKALSEGSGASGGVTVADDGSHAPMTGSHSHPHPGPADELHTHEHSHSDDAAHATHEHTEAQAGAKSAEGVGETDDSTDHTKAFDPEQFGASLEDAITRSLEEARW